MINWLDSAIAILKSIDLVANHLNQIMEKILLGIRSGVSGLL